MVLRNCKAFTLVEMIVSITLFMVLVAPLFGLFIVSKQSASYDGSITDTQEKTRSSMELISRQLKKITSVDANIDNTPDRSRIDFTTVEDLGTCDVWVAEDWLITDFSKNWDTSAWAGARVRIIDGTGTGQSRAIWYNSAYYLIMDAAWATPPDETSVYEIVVEQSFYVDDTQDPPELIYGRAIYDYTHDEPVILTQPFGRNITGLTVSARDSGGNSTVVADDIASLDVQIKAQGEVPRKGVDILDPNSPDAYFEFSVATRVKLRNGVITPPEEEG